MSVSVLQQSSSLDPFLRQAAPLLQTYWNAISKITNQHLMIERKNSPSPEPIMGQGLHIAIGISVPVQFVVGEKKEKHFMSRPRGHKTEQVRSTEEALTLVELVSIYNHKLEKVIKAELKFEEEVKAQGGNLQVRVKKLKDLCKVLEEFSQVVDKIMDIYAKKSLSFDIQACLPSLLEDLKKKKKMIQTLESRIKFHEFHELFEKYSEEFKTTNENILCDIFGMNGEVGDHLFEMDIDLRMHETDLYFLKKYVENKEDEMESGETLETAGKETLRINLQKLGFTENCAETITTCISDEFVDVQKPSFWGIRYLEHSFAHHPLFHNLPRYPFNQDTVDSWFTHEISTEKRDEPEESGSYDRENWEVKMINLSTSKSKEGTLVNEFLKDQGQDESSQLLFHGTTHQSALSILQEGITLSKGSEKQDFSSGDGFYLSELFENAENWNRASMAGKQAVIIFKVDSSLLDADREGGLDLSMNKGEWEEMVKLCRSGYKDKKAKRRLLKDVTFIRGPMCRNPKEFVIGRNSSGFGRNDCIQVCLRDENFANRVGSLANISGVVFY